MPRISALTDTTTITGADEFAIVQGGVTKRITAAEVFSAPPAIGGSTPAAGAFTTVTSTGAIKNGTLTLVDNRLEDYTTNGSANIAVNYNGYLGGTTQFRNFLIFDGKQNQIASFSSTGLAVTGLVSGTGGGFNGTGVMDVISFAGIGLAIGGRFTSSPSSSDYCFIGAQDTGGPGGSSGDLILIPRSSISGQVRIFAGSGTPAQIAAFSSTGLAVTGTISATSYLTVSSGVLDTANCLGVFSGGTWVNTPTATTAYLGVNGSAVCAWSSNGFNVSGGTLTVTGGTITTGSTTALSLATSGGTGLKVGNVASAVNFWEFFGGASGAPGVLSVYAAGTDTNIQLNFNTKGSGPYTFNTDNGNALQVAITHTASANRYITLTGSNGGNPTIGTSAGSLAVSTNLNVTGSITSTYDAGANILTIKSSTQPVLRLTDDGTTNVGDFTIVANLAVLRTITNTPLTFGVNSSEIMRLGADGLSMTTGYIEGAEQTAPAAPAANGYRIFAQDNGAGKTQLMVRFASGASQQIAIEP